MKRRVVSLVLGSFLIAGASVTSLAINDINDHWSKDSVEKLVSERVINGYEDGSFKPDNNITREEVAQLIYKYFNTLIITESTKTDLNDISGRWSKGAIDTLAKAEIIKGYPDNSFKPEKEVTRAELATMIYNALNNCNKYVDKGIKVETKDIENHWAKDNILDLINMGIIEGYPDGTFAPEKSTTRAEAATMLEKVNIDYEDRNNAKIEIEDSKKEDNKAEDKKDDSEKENSSKPKDENKTEVHTVRFTTEAGNKGEIIGNDTFTIKSSSRMNTIPKVNAKPGFVFEGWSINGSKELFSNQRVKEISIEKDTVLKAYFLPEENVGFLPYKDYLYVYVGSYKNPNNGRTYEVMNLDNRVYVGATHLGNISKVFYMDLEKSRNYKKEGISLMEYKGNEKEVIVPNEIEGLPVSFIYSDVFFNKGLTNVILPNNLRSIGSKAFASNNIKNVNFPSSLEFIGTSSFINNTIEEVTVPSTVNLSPLASPFDDGVIINIK